MSSATRTSCELQVLDAAIVEKIEEAVEKVKVREACGGEAPASPCLHLNLCVCVCVGEEEHQEGARDGEASPAVQSEYPGASLLLPETLARSHPRVLLQPLEQQQGVVPDLDAEFRLFDRVVNVRESFTVPLGLRGTVIGIKGGETPGLREHR